MTLFYIDTSALLKKYRTETGTEVVTELFEKKRETEEFTTSYFTVLEATSVIRRLLAAGTLNRRLYQRVLGNLAFIDFSDSDPAYGKTVLRQSIHGHRGLSLSGQSVDHPVGIEQIGHQGREPGLVPSSRAR